MTPRGLARSRRSGGRSIRPWLVRDLNPDRFESIRPPVGGRIVHNYSYRKAQASRAVFTFSTTAVKAWESS